MKCVNTGHGGGRRRTPDAAGRVSEGSPAEHWACCLLGFGGTLALAILFYPVLVAATRPLHLLSSTAIVFVLLFAWLSVWLGAELLVEWLVGRRSVARP